jgi:hypothetical protein
MDWLRTCYDIDMQFDAAGEIIRRVHWYFVPDDTPWFPYPHMFGSSVWMWQSMDVVGVGEYWNSRRRQTNGKVPWPITPPPPELCTPASWYVDGCPSDAPMLRRNALGQATCCLSDGGLYLGGTSVVTVFPPLYGGLFFGGTSITYQDYPRYGGLLLGGTSYARLLYYGYGGLLLGGTSRSYLRYPSYGGLLFGGTSRSWVIRQYTGGISLGGTSNQAIIPLVSGGIELGGKSTVLVAHIGTGGIKLGGTSSVTTSPTTCQPCVLDETRWEASTLYQESIGSYWSQVAVASGGARFSYAGDSFDIVINVTTSAPCGAFIAVGEVYVTFGATFSLATFVSYNARTNTGRWYFPPGSHFLPGQYFDFHFPLP